MMKNIKIIMLFISITAIAQSPWTQEKGNFYTQLSFTTISNYNTLFGDPDRNTQRETTDNTLQFYGEYGLTKSTSLLLNLPLKLIETGNVVNENNAQTPIVTTEGSETALGNIEIGIKHNFYKKDWIFSGQLSVEANTGSYKTASGIRTGYDAFTFTPLLLAGRSFGKTYIQSFVGANVRTNEYSSNVKIGGEIGRKITKHIWLIGFLDIVKSLENGNSILPLENTLTGLYVNNQEYGAFGFKGIGEITNNIGVTAGFGGAFFGNNVAKQAAINVGLYHKF